MRSIFAIVIALVVTGCNSCEECDSDAELIDVEGIWTIEGEGERAGCDDPELNGEFELGPSLKLAVEVFGPARPDLGTTPRDLSVGPDQEMGARDQGIDTDSQTTGDSAVDGLGDATPAEAGLVDSSASDTFTADSGAAADSAAADRGVADGGIDAPGGDLRSGDGAKDSAASDLDHGPGVDSASSRDSRPRRDAYVNPPGWNQQLFRARGGPSGFSLEGEATGTCISFETREESGPYGTVSYYFTGVIDKSGSSTSISGTFSSKDPRGCLVSGDFEVEIR